MTHYLIYKVTNNINGKYYIGKHVTSNLEDGYMGSGDAIRRAIKKYGISNFSKEILFELESIEDLDKKETEIVSVDLCNDPMTYNIALGGQGGCTVLHKDHPLYETTIEKMRKAGKAKSKEISERVKKLHEEKRVGMYGKTHSSETRQRMSDNNAHNKGFLGKRHTEEAVEKIRSANAGKVTSEETKAKISASMKGKLAGSNNPMFGKKRQHSEETKAKMKASRQKYLESRKNEQGV